MSADGTGDPFAERFRAYCEEYLGITRMLGETLTRAAGAGDAGQQMRAFSDGLAALQQQVAGMWTATPFGAPLAGAMPFAAAMPFGSGMPFAAGNAFDPGNPAFAGNPFLGGNPFATLASPWAPAASSPMRAYQELWQRIAALAAELGQAQARLNAQWNQVVATALQQLGERAAALGTASPSPESLQALYDEWVEVAESVYAQAARAPAFAAVQAECGNLQSRMRNAQRELVELAAREFDLPTRTELNAVHEQVRNLKRAVRELEERLAAGGAAKP